MTVLRFYIVTINIELVYVTAANSTVHHKLSLPDSATVADALLISELFKQCPETQQLEVGIFSKRVTAETVLKEGDRIEIYRPLTKNPNDRRRLRAAVKK